MSLIRLSGWALNAVSSSDGETWTPETLSVSFTLSTKLSHVRLRQDDEGKVNQEPCEVSLVISPLVNGEDIPRLEPPVLSERL